MMPIINMVFYRGVWEADFCRSLPWDLGRIGESFPVYSALGSFFDQVSITCEKRKCVFFLQPERCSDCGSWGADPGILAWGVTWICTPPIQEYFGAVAMREICTEDFLGCLLVLK